MNGSNMKKYFASLLAVIIMAVLVNSCKQATEPVTEKPVDESGQVTMRGQVMDSTSNAPLAFAAVKVINGADELTVMADSVGYYKATVLIDKSKQIKLVASKEGYKADTTSVQAVAGSIIDVPAFKLHVNSYVILKGLVVDSNTGNAITGSVVRITNGTNEVQSITDNTGKFTITVPIEKSKDLTLISVKEGYYADTTTVYATLARTIDVPVIKLKVRNSTNVTSGNPASIYLVGQNNQSLGVKESGSVESASLVWEVQDSAGVPVDLTHSATVNFRVGVTPGGGEYISPASAVTNALGRVSINVSSGTKAGVMQIIAEILLPGKTIMSKPVSIAIHGGLPDQTHFSVAPEKLNIAGYNVNGVKDVITAYCGDKYANPVKKGTSVYFTTDGGYIAGSAKTDDMGLGTAILLSTEPRPVHPTLGKGFATITATSADENFKTVRDQTVVLFSGLPFLTIQPQTVNIPHLGSQTFNYTLMDQNGNPMASGQNIAVTVEGDNLKTTGDVSINMPDTQSKAWTQFSFTVTSKDTSSIVRPVNITINTTGPNGAAKLSINGTAK